MVKEMTATERQKRERQQAALDAINREIDGTRKRLRRIHPELAAIFAGLRGRLAYQTHRRINAHLGGAYSAGLKPDVELLWRVVRGADHAMRTRAVGL